VNTAPPSPLKDGIGRNNPVLCQALGICSALAVTTMVSTALVMGGALLVVASLSSLAVSLLRNLIPHRMRLIAQMLVISTLVIVVHLFLRAHYYDMSRALGPYVGLIITNCLILGRTESCALRRRPHIAVLDGFGNALGYAIVLVAIALVREPLGMGTLLGVPVMGANYLPALLISAPPGAFLVAAVVVWIVRGRFPQTDPTLQHPEAGCSGGGACHVR
jgi:Na+-transporting NADH:ubiquinone oxidoreductase subunit D